ncbi:MAG: phospho-N-acetylmuramoyl-pentapeptide-transferase [Clostridia bacterium]|nr:phospho-N-acetylmuramoyl-pentapeptide-transferase [Clostridia bacterium]MBR1685102.1 phospho-N-acetylmuramoyl-pentapeptide-transferase [Clostridia bacterium]MBR2288183.1 phospho-N-acetylmuramoyl-pentapeptide-transferase [Clostridia bacterium]
MMMSLAVGLFLVLLMGPKFIPYLRKMHFGQTIYDLGPQAHKTKQGTPVMGGLMMAFALLVCAIAFHPLPFGGIWDFMPALVLISLLSMAVGFTDDYIKAVKKRHEGLTPKQKIFGQVFVAVAFSVYCYFSPKVGSVILIPFTGLSWDLGIFYIPIMTLLIIFIVNSANLQDGLDGLLSTVTAVSFTGWAALAILMGLAMPEMKADYSCIAVFALALTGAALGFLRFNRYPAKVFMGDTGSMLIGGAIVGCSLLLRQPLMMLLFAWCPIMSSLSVIIQRIYFKLTHGKRIFRMSPIHHHFELVGYSETQIVAMYGTITAVLSILGVLSVLSSLGY